MSANEAKALDMIRSTAKIGLQAGKLLSTERHGSTGGSKTPKAKRKAQRVARRQSR